MINNCIGYLLCAHPVWGRYGRYRSASLSSILSWVHCCQKQRLHSPVSLLWGMALNFWPLKSKLMRWELTQLWRALFFTLLFLFCSFQKDWNANKKDRALVAILGHKVTLGMEDMLRMLEKRQKSPWEHPGLPCQSKTTYFQFLLSKKQEMLTLFKPILV